jgi:bacterioferritin
MDAVTMSRRDGGAGSVEGAVNTMSDTQARLLEGLNADLQGEFQAIIMYRLHASLVQGPYRQELRNFFANEIPEELNHAQLLADKIAALGGTPASTPAPVTWCPTRRRCWRRR